MKTLVIAIICIAAGFGLAYLILSPSTGDGSSESASSDAHKQLYTCGMHPEIISDEPGYCPICGMKLTPKKGGPAAAGAIAIDPTTTQNMGVKTTAARMQVLTRSVPVFGKVAYNASKIYSISRKTEGWAEKVYVTYVGEKISNGQPLLEIYSPELTAAQQEFLLVEKAQADGATDEGLARLKKAARLRLQNWDITDDQIERLIASGEITRTIKVVSPVDGVVIAKNFNEGDQVMPGMELYRIADLSTVWIKGNVYEQDVSFVTLGQVAQVVIPSLTGTSFKGVISYISPYLDPMSQVEIRVELRNDKGLLRPDMYTEVTIESSLPGERLVIPRSAVINSGKKKVIYMAMGDGSFSPREVKTGAVGDDDVIEIVSGLTAGEAVVVSGQFMLDSETRLSEALGGAHIHRPDAINTAVDETSREHHASDRDGHDHDLYTCPMPSHFHVLQYGPGKCPECGMDLAPVEKTKNTEVYVCPMPEDGVVQGKPGRCPKCGMNLIKYQPEVGHDK